MKEPLVDTKLDAYKDGVHLMESDMPETVEAWHRFTGSCFADGAVNAKHKQLIALGISLFANNEVCTLYHVEEALANGASRLEIMETVSVAAALGSGHAFSQGVTRVRKALGEQAST